MLRRGGLTGEGQTSVDFLIGFSIFAITLLFVLQTVTGPVVKTSSQSQTKDAVAQRTGSILLSNWSETEGTIRNDTAADYLDDGYDVIADDINIPKKNGNLLYRYNITVTDIDNISAEPPTPVEPGLTAGNSTDGKNFENIAGERRVVYLNKTTGNDEMVSVRVKIW